MPTTSTWATSAPPSNTCRLLARDHAAPEPTLALAKASSLGRGVRPLAWCSRPRNSAASLEGALVENALEHADGRVACERCLVADSPLTRLRGLLGRGPLDEGQGLLLRPAAAIHTWFMRRPIDAVFLDRRLVVVDVATNVRPWRFAARRGARSVLELAAGESSRRAIGPGSRLHVRPTSAPSGAR